MNRCMRDPHVQWCERLSLPVSGRAAYSMCALQEHERTRTQFTQKNSKILIKICVTSERENKFPEGESPLYARPQTGLKY